MKSFCIEGVATEFGKCFQQADRVLYLKPGCFSESIESGNSGGSRVKLHYDHDSEAFPHRKLELYSGEKALVFRLEIPDSRGDDDDLSNFADDHNTYLAVSIGYKDSTVETMTFDGVQVSCVVKATLQEVSLLAQPPAVDTTYARIVDVAKCNTLEEDYQMILLTGRYIGIHRKVLAKENDGKIKYNHATSAYDRAANNFEAALQRLM